jgi:c-di-GMP-binding flagellar brake protein YcgR
VGHTLQCLSLTESWTPKADAKLEEVSAPHPQPDPKPTFEAKRPESKNESSRVNEHSRELPVHYPLDVDQGISIKGKSMGKQEARVVKISPKTEIRLELSPSSTENDYKYGEQVWVQFRDQGTVYCWKAEVVKVSGSDHWSVALSIGSEGMILQQRNAPRVRVPFPFSFMVTSSAEPSLTNQMRHDCKVRDISVGGLRFETPLQLKTGDTLALELQLSSSYRLRALGSVVRSKEIEYHGKCLHTVGVKFLQSDPEGQQVLADLIAQFTDSVSQKL